MGDSVETLLREILAGQAVFRSELEGVKAQGEKTADVAERALEVSTRISTILEEQDMGARFAEHRNDTRQMVTEIRQDFVAANTKMRNDFEAVRRDVETRLAALETDKANRAGATTLAKWLTEKAPWVLAIVMGLAALAAKFDVGDKVK